MKAELVKLISRSSSLTSVYFKCHYILNSGFGVGLLMYFAYYFAFSQDLVCYCDPEMKVEFETHCWNSMEVDVWKQVVPFLCGQLCLLLLPFLIWKVKDKNLLKGVTANNSVEDIADFFVKTRKGHKMYVLSYVALEFCNLLLVALLSWLMYWIFGVTVFDVYTDLQADPDARTNVWDQAFPLHTKCEWSHNSMIPGVIDRYSSRCDIKLNGVRKQIFVINMVFITLLGGLGVLNFFMKLLVVFIRPLRQCRLMCSAGCARTNVALNALGKRLGYCDYVILVGIGSQVSTHLFTSLCIILHNQMYRIDVMDQLEDAMEMTSDQSSPVDQPEEDETAM